SNNSNKPINLPNQEQHPLLLTMSIFKSNKNKTASAATTPSQTPRSSMQNTRPASSSPAKGMTRDEALESLMKKSLGTTFNYIL
ncbi:hypothetical protein BGZ93_001110, partial [Podila epicladia]